MAACTPFRLTNYKVLSLCMLSVAVCGRSWYVFCLYGRTVKEMSSSVFFLNTFHWPHWKTPWGHGKMWRKNNNYVRKDKHGVSAIWLHLHRDTYYATVDVVDALQVTFSTTFLMLRPVHSLRVISYRKCKWLQHGEKYEWVSGWINTAAKWSKYRGTPVSPMATGV